MDCNFFPSSAFHIFRSLSFFPSLSPLLFSYSSFLPSLLPFPLLSTTPFSLSSSISTSLLSQTQRLPNLHKMLNNMVDVSSDPKWKVSLHPVHQQRESFDHPNHLHQRVLFLARVVVACCLGWKQKHTISLSTQHFFTLSQVSFPGFTAPECKHDNHEGGESLVSFLSTWATWG